MRRTHYLPADYVHNKWDIGNEPVITIDSGDTVVFWTRGSCPRPGHSVPESFGHCLRRGPT
jgi:acetamidase/formamidase